MSIAFRKLDHNRSGSLERDDLIRAMKRQLRLARRLVPLLVRQQLRREGAAGLLGPGGLACVEDVREQASADATAALDNLNDQHEDLVGAIFDEFGAAERITLAQWRDTWRRAASGESGSVHRMMGIDGVLGLIARGEATGSSDSGWGEQTKLAAHEG